ncbi:hypothetical protein VCHA53O466_40126 [Vibrio chagasii]|nr:hypothetical protein VCHA53O466_40126 [Vibrio chagasii]
MSMIEYRTLNGYKAINQKFELSPSKMSRESMLVLGKQQAQRAKIMLLCSTLLLSILCLSLLIDMGVLRGVICIALTCYSLAWLKAMRQWQDWRTHVDENPTIGIDRNNNSTHTVCNKTPKIIFFKRHKQEAANESILDPDAPIKRSPTLSLVTKDTQ